MLSFDVINTSPLFPLVITALSVGLNASAAVQVFSRVSNTAGTFNPGSDPEAAVVALLFPLGSNPPFAFQRDQRAQVGSFNDSAATDPSIAAGDFAWSNAVYWSPSLPLAGLNATAGALEARSAARLVPRG